MRDWANYRHYGWVIAIAMLLVQTVSSGLGFYNMSVYMSFFARELDASLDAISLSVSLFFISGGVAGLFVARLLERWDIRMIMVIGASVSGVALLLIGRASNLYELYALFTLFGIGNTGVSIVVATSLITQWFPDERRSVALSISSTGLSLGGVLITPYTAYLFDKSGIFEAMPLLGVIFVVGIVPIVILFIRPPVTLQAVKETKRNFEMEYLLARKSRFFVCVTTAYVLIMAAQVGGIAHLYNRVDALGGLGVAAGSIQALTLASISGRLLGGWLLTRITIRPFLFFNLLIQLLGLFLIGFSEMSEVAILSSIFFGFSVGNLLMLQPLWLAEIYPSNIYPRLFALSNAYSVIGVAFGPYLLGLVYVNSDYSVAYLVASVVSLTALVIIYSAGQPVSKVQSKL